MYRICLGMVKARASANVSFQIVSSLSRFNALHAWWYVGYMTPSIVLKSSKLVGPHRCSNNVLMKNCSRYFVETLFTRPITYVPPRWRTLWLYYGPCKSVEMAGWCRDDSLASISNWIDLKILLETMNVESFFTPFPYQNEISSFFLLYSKIS